jgi:hypothetical protein
MIAEELAAAGIAVHLAEPAGTTFARGRKRHAKTGKTGCRHPRMLLAQGRLPECWIPPGHIPECRARLETCHDPRAEHTAWVQRIHAVLLHHGAPAWARGRCVPGRARPALRAAAAVHLSPAGQLQVATALEVTGALQARMHVPRHQLTAAARHRGAGGTAVQGRAGHRAGADLPAGRGRPVLLRPPGGPVRRAGRHRLLLRPQGPARAAVPAGTARAALGGVRGRPDPRPILGPRPRLGRRPAALLAGTAAVVFAGWLAASASR